MYDEAVAELDTERMWRLYLDTVAELDAAAEKKTGRQSARYVHVLTRAADAGRLPFEHCLSMVERLESADEITKAAFVIDSVVARSPPLDQLTQLLKEKLELLCRHKIELSEVSEAFFGALDSLAKFRKASLSWTKDAKSL